jgi:uncharacterized YccA/Bax inhibitor family protein
MDTTAFDTALALSFTLCGIAGGVLIGLVAHFYTEDRSASPEL